MNKNTNSSRYYSDIQEKYVAKLLGGYQTTNSGAGHWSKSDVVVKDANMSIECKTSMSEKSSFSIKKDWIDKHKEEAKSNHLYNTAIAISFDPLGKENYFVIDEKLMKFLVEKLEEENE